MPETPLPQRPGADGEASPPRVTIAVPTYNRAGLLREALESALAQSFTDFELLVLDDCSAEDDGSSSGVSSFRASATSSAPDVSSPSSDTVISFRTGGSSGVGSSFHTTSKSTAACMPAEMSIAMDMGLRTPPLHSYGPDGIPWSPRDVPLRP